MKLITYLQLRKVLSLLLFVYIKRHFTIVNFKIYILVRLINLFNVEISISRIEYSKVNGATATRRLLIYIIITKKGLIKPLSSFLHTRTTRFDMPSTLYIDFLYVAPKYVRSLNMNLSKTLWICHLALRLSQVVYTTIVSFSLPTLYCKKVLAITNCKIKIH